MTTQVYADRAENAEIWDKAGNRYIDFAAGIATEDGEGGGEASHGPAEAEQGQARQGEGDQKGGGSY